MEIRKSYLVRKKVFDFIFKAFIYFVSLIIVLLLFFIIFFIFKEFLLLFTKGYINEYANIKNLFSEMWQPVSVEPKYGIIPLVMGSSKVAFVALLLGLPLGVLSALYVTVYSPHWFKETIKPVIELIAGLPTVVIGFFMLMVAASFLQNIFQFDYRLNAIVGGIGVSIVIIPIVFTISEERMNSIPRSIIEAAYAIGASKHHVAWKVILPYSLNAIFSSAIIGGMRAFGETMIVMMATGNAPIPLWDLTLPVRTMSATIGSEMGEVHIGDEHYTVLFVIGFLLLFITIIFNIIANLISNLIRKKLYS
ncbi:MAG: phosphate ABC transporter permease subunit PstC [Brevinematia bacterium]